MKTILISLSIILVSCSTDNTTYKNNTDRKRDSNQAVIDKMIIDLDDKFVKQDSLINKLINAILTA